MRRPPAVHLTVIGSLLILLGCSSDQSALTAPETTLGFARAGTPITSTNGYSFALTCHNTSGNSSADLTTNGTSANSFSLICGGTESRGAGTSHPGSQFTSFTYIIHLRNSNAQEVALCSQTDITTTGSFKCSTKKWSAALTVTDLGPPPA